MSRHGAGAGQCSHRPTKAATCESTHRTHHVRLRKRHRRSSGREGGSRLASEQREVTTGVVEP